MVRFSDVEVDEANADTLPDIPPVDEVGDKAHTLSNTAAAKVRNPAASQRTYEQLITAMSAEFHRMQAEIEVLSRQNQMLLPGKSSSDAFLHSSPPRSKQVIAPSALRPSGDVLPDTDEQGADFKRQSTPSSIEAPQPAAAAKAVSPEQPTRRRNAGRRSVLSTVMTEKKARQSMAAAKMQSNESEHPPAAEAAMLAAQQVEAEHMQIIVAQGRQEQFKRLDLSVTGSLSPWDVAKVAQILGEDIDEDTAALAFKFISDAQPNRSISQPETSICFNGYLMLMNDEICVAEASDKVSHALHLVKSLFLHEANEHRSKVILDGEKQKFQARTMKSRMTVLLDIASVVVICVHSLVIGISVDVAPNDIAWQVIELIFFVYYVGEVFFKFKLFGCYSFWRGADWLWNVFDVSCIALSCVDMSFTYRSSDQDEQEVGQLMLVKMFRMARMTRIVRVMRFKMFKELKLIILGLFSGLRALFWAIILLMVFIYILAILLKSFVGEREREFSTVDAAMFTLFRCFTDGCATYSGTPLSERLRMRYGWLFFIMYILIMMMVTVGIFNLIMAVFIDNVTKSQQQRKQKELGDTMEAVEAELKLQVARFILNPQMEDEADGKTLLQRLSDHARQQLAQLTDEDGIKTRAAKLGSADACFAVLTSEEVTVSRDVFHSWLLDKDFVHVLEEAEVDISNKFELFDILDVDMGGELSAEELVNGLLKLRGDVSKGDIVAIMLKSIHITRQLEELRSSGVKDKEP